MDSPESDPTPSGSPAVQDSPFFNYLSTLSPIKPVRDINVVRGFSQLDFPPPLPVFTSPRLNQDRESRFIKRAQFAVSSILEFNSEYDRAKPLSLGIETSTQFCSQTISEVIPLSQKGYDDTRNTEENQTPSHSGCVDDYLADPPDEPVDSVDSHYLNLKPASKLSEEPLKDLHNTKEATVKVHDNDSDKNVELHDNVGMTKSFVCTETFTVSDDVKTVSGFKLNNNAENLHSTSSSENVSDMIKSHFSLESKSDNDNENRIEKNVKSFMKSNKNQGRTFDQKNCIDLPTFEKHGCIDVKLLPLEMELNIEQNPALKQFPGSLKSTQINNCHSPNIEELPHEGVGKHVASIPEDVVQHPRAMARRLQFDSMEGCRKNSEDVDIHVSSENSMSLDALNTGHVETNSSIQDVDLSKSLSSRFPCSYKTPESSVEKGELSTRNRGLSSIVPIPSGIGLHLNSIGTTTINRGMSGKDNLGVNGEVSLLSTNICCLVEESSSSMSMSLSVQHSIKVTADSEVPSTYVIETSEEAQHENNNPVIDQFSHETKPLEKPSYLNSIRQQAFSNEIQNPPSHSTSGIDEYNQMSPRKKRKRGTDIVEPEGCKRCNCKKSKCLKLYCDCFAAGVYCAEPCACQDCFNKPEYEDMVLGTRQQIESRNPIAFAPKIVRRITESPPIAEDGVRMTPASARHKRGCNCKKSLCLKKYCECYQAGVGCSEGCRCEGCKNPFGRKEGWDSQIDSKLDIVESRNDTLHSEQHRAHHLSPLTPLHPFSCQDADAPKSGLPGRRYLQTPESDISSLSVYGKSPESPEHSHNKDSLVRENHHDLCLSDSKASKLDKYSPRNDYLTDTYDHTPLVRPPKRLLSSASSNMRECSKISRKQPCHVNEKFSIRSLGWHASPVTPTPQFREGKYVNDPDSDRGMYSILSEETPDILKDTNSPVKTVKTSSPKQKRVSPPHNLIHELRKSSPSPGLRSGRKFILQSVPSFPSLTPYSDSKGSEK